MAENKNKITDIIQTSLEEIKQVVDANTIIGTPINTPNGTTIIPVSKIMVGFASGGLDYMGKNPKKTEESSTPIQNNFGGGGGTGVTVQPVGFLVVSANGDVQLLNVGANAVGNDKIESISNLIERSPDVIAKIAAIFKKDGGKKKKSDTESDGKNTDTDKTDTKDSPDTDTKAADKTDK